MPPPTVPITFPTPPDPLLPLPISMMLILSMPASFDADDGRLLLAFRGENRRLPLRFSRSDDRRQQLLLAARRFLGLDQHFLLATDLLDAGLLLGDLLAGDRRGERPRL